MIKIGSIGYVPPPHFPGAEAFLRNIRKYPARHEVVLYSDHDYPEAIKIFNPEQIQGSLKVTPARDQWDRENRKWVVNNAIFITGLKIAVKNGFTHIIYLESDCRVGQLAWDQPIFNEYFSFKFPPIAAGTLVCWNPFNAGIEVARKWEELVTSTNRSRNFPIPTYGVRREGMPGPMGDPCIFPNGALGVYDVNWLASLFDVNNAVAFASGTAWDFQIGMAIWQQFGIRAFEMVGHMGTMFSGYGDEVTTLEQRLQMLRDGSAAAVHQIKGNIEV